MAQQWTTQDEIDLIKALVVCGLDNWGQVARKLSGQRTAEQIKHRFFKLILIDLFTIRTPKLDILLLCSRHGGQ